MFRIFKYVPKVSPMGQAQYRAKQMRINAGNGMILDYYKEQILKDIYNKNDIGLLVTLEQMFMEELTLGEITLMKDISIDAFIDNYKKYGILGFVHCCY